MKVLIADDSVVSRRLLEAMLRKWDYEVIVACDGAEAWEVLQRPDSPRLAILDWMMPGLSGPEVCRKVRERAGNVYTYILLLTSRNEREDLIEGMEAGADDYITKPFDQHELKVRLGPGRRIVELEDQLLTVQKELELQATRDSLTGLWNRHSILEILDRELSRAIREVIPLGVAMGDLDRFKNVNDTYGHIAGDSVLSQVAGRMNDCVRPYDAVGRYGGEEFLIILPGCDEAAVEGYGERIRQEIERAPMQTPDGDLHITASFGVASLPRGREATAEELIRLADRAMYRAKEAGRNRVMLATEGVRWEVTTALRELSAERSGSD